MFTLEDGYLGFLGIHMRGPIITVMCLFGIHMRGPVYRLSDRYVFFLAALSAYLHAKRLERNHGV
jgi:hypothetical protein